MLQKHENDPPWHGSGHRMKTQKTVEGGQNEGLGLMFTLIV